MNDEILVEETEEVLEDFSANLHPYDLPGEWFVLNAQSGHEKKVRTNILTRIKNLHLDDKVYDVVIPTDEVVEIRNGKKVNVEKKTFPGYVLVRMDLDDTTWYEIRNTPSIIGFVGSGKLPVSLSRREIERILEKDKSSIVLNAPRNRNPCISFTLRSIPRNAPELFPPGVDIAATAFISYDSKTILPIPIASI